MTGWTRLSNDSFNVALFAYLLGMVGYFCYLAFRVERIWRIASICAYVGLTSHIASVFARGFAAGRVPWGNMYEYSSMMALLVTAAYLFIAELRFKVRTLGGPALAASVLTMAIAVSFLYVGPGPLVPALNSYWIKIHVVAAILGSSLFTLGGGVFTSLFLLQSRREERVRDVASDSPAPIMGGSTSVAEAVAETPRTPDVVPKERRGRLAMLPSAEVLDSLAYKTIAFAFPIWTFAVIAGAIWAQQAWGRYWGWDPKETWSFVTWTVYAGYLHARSTAGWKGRRAAIIALVGVAALLVNYYVVNLWIVGLHSYKGF
jgi:cytochrome c-type biogenesis protein CcsB